MQAVKKNLFSMDEVTILRVLKRHEETRREKPASDVNEISTETGIRDKDEILRALYTLEGKSLVQPDPAGDFTSNQWKITNIGLKAIELF